MITDKEFADKVHMLIHSLRLITGYKPSQAEMKISSWVIEKYSNNCDECKKAGDVIKNIKPQQSFLKKIGEVLNDA